MHSLECKEKIRQSCLNRGVGKWMSGRIMAENVKLKISAKLKGKKLSEETKLKISRANIGKKKPWARENGFKKGVDAWNFGEKTELKTRLKSSVSHKSYWNKVGVSDVKRYHHTKDMRYVEWRTSVFERDDFTCQACGIVGNELNAHHIKSWALYSSLRYDLSNGVTLCKKCHKSEHSKIEN